MTSQHDKKMKGSVPKNNASHDDEYVDGQNVPLYNENLFQSPRPENKLEVKFCP